jgi:hypothetical protein
MGHPAACLVLTGMLSLELAIRRLESLMSNGALLLKLTFKIIKVLFRIFSWAFESYRGRSDKRAMNTNGTFRDYNPTIDSRVEAGKAALKAHLEAKAAKAAAKREKLVRLRDNSLNSRYDRAAFLRAEKLKKATARATRRTVQ